MSVTVSVLVVICVSSNCKDLGVRILDIIPPRKGEYNDRAAVSMRYSKI